MSRLWHVIWICFWTYTGMDQRRFKSLDRAYGTSRNGILAPFLNNGNGGATVGQWLVPPPCLPLYMRLEVMDKRSLKVY